MKLYATGVLLAVVSGAPAQADEAGAALYEPCRSCHSLDPAGPVMAGPNLARLVGRRVGSDPRFDYSPVLRKAAAENRVWTIEMLDTFLADPEAMFPGMWMTGRPMPEGERRALVRFLASPDTR
jgi:cytochrome c